jgi:hypothetical protein
MRKSVQKVRAPRTEDVIMIQADAQLAVLKLVTRGERAHDEHLAALLTTLGEAGVSYRE